MKTLSIVIPAFNEENTILDIINKVQSVKLHGGIQKELIIVNDCSTDLTEDYVNEFIKKNPKVTIAYHKHEKNKGKGAALTTGFSMATGNFVVVQDADLEYDPNEYNDLLKPILDGYADVVYGSRFKGSKPHRTLFFWHTLGNQFLTFLSNVYGRK